MAKKRDYYEILGVSRTATDDEIKKAYRKLAKQYHPDVSKEADAEEKFKEATEAAEILLDQNKRKTYDQFGHDGLQGSSQGFGGFGGFEDFFSKMSGDGDDFFSDIFGSFFGGNRKRSSGGFSDFSRNSEKQSRVKDEVIDLHLTLKELLFGVEKEVELNLIMLCATCDGVGAVNKSDVKKCDMCDGHGSVVMLKDMGIAKFQTQQICPKCKGYGELITHPCKSCQGKKVIVKKQKIVLPIPKGLTPGQQIVLRNAGNYSPNSSERGHIYGNVHLKILKNIEIVNQYDIKTTLNVSYIDVLLENSITVETLDGSISIKLPKKVKNGDVITVANYGLHKGINSSKRANILFVINIVLPDKLSDFEKTSIKEIAKKTDFVVKNEVKG